MAVPRVINSIIDNASHKDSPRVRQLSVEALGNLVKYSKAFHFNGDLHQLIGYKWNTQRMRTLKG
jgi:hypothetical protein